MKRLTCEEMRTICIKNGWFNEGTNAQYEKLFYAVRNGFSMAEIVTILWTCSDAEREDIQAYMESHCGDDAPACDTCTDKRVCSEYLPCKECVNDRSMAGGGADAVDP